MLAWLTTLVLDQACIVGHKYFDYIVFARTEAEHVHEGLLESGILGIRKCSLVENAVRIRHNTGEQLQKYLFRMYFDLYKEP